MAEIKCCFLPDHVVCRHFRCDVISADVISAYDVISALTAHARPN